MLGGFWVGLLLGVNRLGVHDFEARVVVALSHELAGNKVHPVLRLVKHTENHVPIHFEADGDFKLLRHWFGLSLVVGWVAGMSEVKSAVPTKVPTKEKAYKQREKRLCRIRK